MPQLAPGRALRNATRAAARVIALGAVLTMAAFAAPAVAAPPPPCDTATDKVCARAVGDLASFTGWLTKHNVKGYIGEVGWPTYPNNNDTYDGYLWGQVGERWFQAADAAGLPVTGWAAGEWYQPGAPLNIYEQPSYTAAYNPLKPLSARRIQADVFEAHYGLSGGVNSVGGEGTQASASIEATSAFSNKNPGTYDNSWHYDSQTSFNYLKARGVKVIRLLFRWERLQPAVGGPIDTAGKGFTELSKAIDRATTAGLKVIVAPHNFGGYYEYSSSAGKGVRKTIGVVGTDVMHYSRFADFWGQLATQLKGKTGLLGYGLMNEPAAMKPWVTMYGTWSPTKVWETASQSAVSAIRAVDPTHTIYVPAYAWDSVRSFEACHPKGPWITKDATNIRYEAHQYFDADRSGSYANTYAAEKSMAGTAQGAPSC